MNWNTTIIIVERIEHATDQGFSVLYKGRYIWFPKSKTHITDYDGLLKIEVPICILQNNYAKGKLLKKAVA